MKRIALAAAACLVLAGPSFAQSTSESMKDKAKSVGESTGVNALIGVAPTTEDFVKQAVMSDQFEEASGGYAEKQGGDKVKSFAKKLQTDHAGSTKDLITMVQGGKVKVDIPKDLDSTHQSKIDKLKDLKGADFDKQFTSDQVSAHKTVVDLYKRYADGGDNPDLKAWAAKKLPEMQDHLKLAEDLDK